MESQTQFPQNKKSSSLISNYTNNYFLLVKLAWILAALSVIACLIRNDYNVLFSYFVLVVLHKFYNENSFFYTKSLIHLTFATVFVDLLWLIIIIPLWNQSEDYSEYWQSLSGIHNIILFVALLELVVKFVMIFLYVLDFKKFNGDDTYSKLFNFNYAEASPKIVIGK